MYVCEKQFRALMKTFRVIDPAEPPPITPGLCALAVITKAPQAGQVKTRLVPPLTPDEAAELNKCFLRDTTAAISSVTAHHDASGIAVYTPIGSESAYADILPGNFSLLPQRGTGFGERLYYATDDLFKCGFGSVCLIDSDSPSVSASSFSQAVHELAEPGDRVVLGPCDDGGYYLIGLKKPHRKLFELIDWSTERVFDQTMQRAREIGLEVKLLPPGYDIDDAASLRRLCNEVLGDSVCTDVASHTRKFVRQLIGQKKLWLRAQSTELNLRR
jgi:rSAM/selenodomain-associated transferase 1